MNKSLFALFYLNNRLVTREVLIAFINLYSDLHKGILDRRGLVGVAYRVADLSRLLKPHGGPALTGYH